MNGCFKNICSYRDTVKFVSKYLLKISRDKVNGSVNETKLFFLLKIIPNVDGKRLICTL